MRACPWATAMEHTEIETIIRARSREIADRLASGHVEEVCGSATLAGCPAEGLRALLERFRLTLRPRPVGVPAEMSVYGPGSCADRAIWSVEVRMWTVEEGRSALHLDLEFEAYDDGLRWRIKDLLY